MNLLYGVNCLPVVVHAGWRVDIPCGDRRREIAGANAVLVSDASSLMFCDSPLIEIRRRPEWQDLSDI